MTSTKLYSMPMPCAMGHHDKDKLKNILKLQRIERESDLRKLGDEVTLDELRKFEGISIASNGMDIYQKMTATKYTAEEAAEFVKVMKSIEVELKKLAVKIPLPASVLNNITESARAKYEDQQSATIPMMGLLGLACLSMAFEQLDGDEQVVVVPKAGFTIADRVNIITTFVRTWAVSSTIGMLHEAGVDAIQALDIVSLQALIEGVPYQSLQYATDKMNSDDETDDASGSDSSTVSVPV